MKRIVLTLLLVGALAGCHTMRFDISPDASAPPISDMKSYFLFGLVPTRQIDLAQYCPNGTAAIVEETTFLDGFCGLITLGIWTPRTSRYYCSGGAA